MIWLLKKNNKSGPILVKLAVSYGILSLARLHISLLPYLTFMYTEYFGTVPLNKSHHPGFISNFITELFKLHTCFTYVT